MSVLLILIALLVSLPGAFSSEAIYPDGQRYLFNGLLIHDLIRDRSLFDVYSYAKTYYSHYPAFNLPYGPPFFAAQFALLFALFGLSFSVARLLVVAYTVFSALACLQLTLNAHRSRHVAFIASMLLICNPLSLQYSRDIATEIPVIFFSIATLHTAYHFIVHSKKGYGLASALFLGLGYLTKQYILPLALGLGLYVLCTRKLKCIKSRETLWAILILAILTIPYTVISLGYATNDFGVKFFPPMSFELVSGYFLTALRCVPFVTVLAGCGFAIGLRNKDDLTGICFCWLICWWLFFTFIYGYYVNESRYILIIMPALVYPAALALNTLISHVNNKKTSALVILILCIYTAWSTLQTPVRSLWGYSEAGNYVGTQTKNGSVLFSGSYDGNFLFGIRQVCPVESPFVLRSNQWLANRLWWGELKNTTSVLSPEQIVKFVSAYHIEYIVIELGNERYNTYQEHINLHKVLRTNDGFDRVAVFPIRTDPKNKTSRKLEVYKSPFPTGDVPSLDSIPIRPSARLRRESG